MGTKKTESPLDRLVNAAVMAASVIYCNGLVDLSDQMAFESVSEALKPFGGMPRTWAMEDADKRWKQIEKAGKKARKTPVKKES